MGFFETQEKHDNQDSESVEYWKRLRDALENVKAGILTDDNIEIIDMHIKTLETAIDLETKKE